jgi:hypothetical protein
MLSLGGLPGQGEQVGVPLFGTQEHQGGCLTTHGEMWELQRMAVSVRDCRDPPRQAAWWQSLRHVTYDAVMGQGLARRSLFFVDSYGDIAVLILLPI